MNLTLAQLNAISPAIKGVRGQRIVEALNSVCPMYGIDDRDIFPEFIGQVLKESAEFSRFEENMNYSVEGLMMFVRWGRITRQQAESLGRVDKTSKTRGRPADKKGIAKAIYGGKYGKENLGNIIGSCDGWTLRGSGCTQCTGRWVLSGAMEWYNKLLVERMHNPAGVYYTVECFAADLRDNSKISLSVHSACWLFAVYKKLIPYAYKDDIKAITKKITGGSIGIEDRIMWTKRAEKYYKG